MIIIIVVVIELVVPGVGVGVDAPPGRRMADGQLQEPMMPSAPSLLLLLLLLLLLPLLLLQPGGPARKVQVAGTAQVPGHLHSAQPQPAGCAADRLPVRR